MRSFIDDSVSGVDYDPLLALESDFTYDANSSPINLSFSSLCAGYRPPRFFESFNYLEIGLEQSLSVLIHASSYPHGNFYIVDQNPVQVSNIKEMAIKIGLSNVEAIEMDFGDRLLRGLPSMDYVFISRILPRLNEQKEEQLIFMLNHIINPGGLLYLNYEIMPHWSVYHGMLHLLRLFFQRTQGPLELRVSESLNFLQQGIESDLSNLSHSRGKKFFLEISKMKPRELAYKFLLCDEWQPRYFPDISDQMSLAKLNYLAPANLQGQVVAQGLPSHAREILGDFDDGVTQEFLKDVLINQPERFDIFGKGRIQATMTDLRVFFENLRVFPLRERKDYLSEATLSIGKLATPEHSHDDIYDLLDKGNNNLLELSIALGGKHVALLHRLRIAILLGNVAIALEGDNSLSEKRCRDYNHEIFGWFHDKQFYLASPVLGSGVEVSLFELYSLEHSEINDPKELSSKVLAKMRSVGGDFKINNESVKDGKDFYQKAGRVFDDFVNNKRALLSRMGIST